MIVSKIKVDTGPENKEEILEILFSLKGPTEVKSGCLGCEIYQDLQNESIIVYTEVWKSKEKLNSHIRSNHYRKLLAVIDMSLKQPEITFCAVTKTMGMEMIKEALD